MKPGANECRTVQETARDWGVSPRNVQRLLAEGRVPGAAKYGNAWMIPAAAEKPRDPRGKARKPNAPAAARPLPRQCPLLTMTDLYGKPGTADQVCASLARDPAAQALFAAQLAYLQGRPGEAGARCAALLETASRPDLRLGCLCVTAYAAMYAGSLSAWQSAREAVAGMPGGDPPEAALRDLCLASVDLSQFEPRHCPEWLTVGSFDLLPGDALAMAGYLYMKYLTLNRDTIPMTALLEPLCAQARSAGGVAAEIYLRLLVAMGWSARGNEERAALHISRALDLALADGLYTPLAENRSNLGTLFDTLLRQRDPEAYRRVAALGERLIPNWTALFEQRTGRYQAADLTQREQDALHMAAFGLTNGEIARRMGLSENTVRGYIASALGKAGLKNRRELKRYFTYGAPVNHPK